jgi:hypothetical protein
MFQPYVVITSDNTLVLLNCIESINISRLPEDEIADKLKDDVFILITTISGKTYEISMKHQCNSFDKSYNITNDLVKLRSEIVEHWLNLNSQGK